MSTDSSTLWVCKGSPAPAGNSVIPVVSLFPSAFHLPTWGSVRTPAPRLTGSISACRSTSGASGVASIMAARLAARSG